MQESDATTQQLPVFVTAGRHRHHAVRLAAATVGLLLAGWLAALLVGLVGFAPLGELPLPGSGHGQSGPATTPSICSSRADRRWDGSRL